MTKKLYKVQCKGHHEDYTFYVVAYDPTTAYDSVRKYLDTNAIGFPKYRELETITLIAEDYRYTEGTRLIIV